MMTKPTHTERQQITIRLPQPVLEAINKAAAHAGVSTQDQIEARLVESLLAEKLIDLPAVMRSCGAFAATAAYVSKSDAA